MRQLDVVVFGFYVPAVDVHRIQRKDGIGLVHTDADGVQQRGIAPRAFKACIQHKCGDGHADGADRAHGAVYEEIRAACDDDGPGDFGNRRLEKMIGNKGQLHFGVDPGAGIVGAVELLCLRAQKMVGFHLRNALQVLHDPVDQLYVAGNLFLGYLLARLLHFGVDQEENNHACSGNQADPPIKA